MIPEDAVKLAADYLPHDRDCAGWFPCTCRHLREATMTAALEAAAPFLRAQALEDAEKVVDDELQDAPSPCYEENDYEAGYIAGLTFAQELLRARAVTERGGE